MEPSAKTPLRLVEIDTGRVFQLDAEMLTVGRLDPRTGIKPDIDLAELDPDRSISRRHAVIRKSSSGNCAVVDEKGALNGTYLNGLRLAPAQLHPVRAGDFLVFGLVGFRVEHAVDDAGAPAPASAKSVAAPVEALAKMAQEKSNDPGKTVVSEKARPSFAFGLNENIDVDGKVYHAQTEDLGWESEQILTIVYASGSVLMSKKTPYAFFYERLGEDIKPAEMIRFQHRGIVVGLKKGKILARLPRPASDS